VLGTTRRGGSCRKGALLDQWRQIKERASDAVLEGGGTITHHHAVGRDHMPSYQRQRPALFGAALPAAKRTLDPPPPAEGAFEVEADGSRAVLATRRWPMLRAAGSDPTRTAALIDSLPASVLRVAALIPL
jgi:FAD linked oxidases, C-terminal domain